MMQNYPISAMIPLEAPRIQIDKKPLETILESLREPSAEDRAQALERQGRTQAHTVYYSGDSIIGVLWKNGTVAFGSNNSIGNQAVQQAYNSGQLDGISGEKLVKRLSEIIDVAFDKSKSYVKTETYESGNAPTMALLSHQIDWMENYPMLSSHLDFYA